MGSIRFTGAATRWLECLPLGDGRLGAMTDGGIAATTLHLNDATAWSGSPASEGEGGMPDAAECACLLAEARAAIAAGDPVAAEAPLRAMQTRYAQSYLPLGDIRIEAAGASAAGSAGLVRELDLRTGIHRSQEGDATATTFITAEHSVLVHVVAGAGPLRVTVDSPLRALDVDLGEPTGPTADGDEVLLLRLPSDVAPGHEPDLPPARWDGPAVEAAIVARVVRGHDRTVVLIAAATTFAAPGLEPSGSAIDALALARDRIDCVAAEDPDTLAAASAAGLQSLLGDVSIAFDEELPASPSHADIRGRLDTARRDPRGLLRSDPGLVALLFDYGRYLLACSSRDGDLPATLQGIWNAEMRPPWGSGYTLNINTEMNYWGAQVTDLASCMRPLTDFTIALSHAARAHTARLYGAPGWTVHHNTDAWLYATAPGRGAGDPRWAFWPLGGAWLATLLTEAWDFGADDEAGLARIWPALRGAAEFALAWHRDGSTAPATSPENAFLTADGTPASLAATTTMDLAMLRTLFDRTARVAGVLGRADDPIAAAAADRLAALPAQPELTPEGTIVEWDAPRAEEDPHHRHLSPLYGLFPGDEHWDDDRRAGAARTLDRRGDDSSGWSLVWKLALWARLGRGDRVGPLLELAMRDAEELRGPWAGGLYPNLFAAHPPFQIDANLGFVGALAETVLQSHDGIHLLPALPAGLSSGRATGLVARPGIIVGMRWRDGELVSATLRARRPASEGRHRVRWRDRTIAVPILAGQDTILTARSFDAEEAHP